MPPLKDLITSLQLRLFAERSACHYSTAKKTTTQQQTTQTNQQKTEKRKIIFWSKFSAIYQDRHDSGGHATTHPHLHANATILTFLRVDRVHVATRSRLLALFHTHSSMLGQAARADSRWVTSYLFTFWFNQGSDKLHQLFCNNHIYMFPSHLPSAERINLANVLYDVFRTNLDRLYDSSFVSLRGS